LSIYWSDPEIDLDAAQKQLRRAYALRTIGRPMSLMEIARQELTMEVNRWIEAGAGRWHFAWGWDGHPRIELAGNGLWGVLARQLTFAVRRERPFVRCGWCGEWFYPRRQPRSDRRTWCRKSECQRARVRLAVRKTRARQGCS
jgi:hypothetical protein